MASPKTGGNKKESSQSDKNYWNRAKASNYSETHKVKRMIRHAKRMGHLKYPSPQERDSYIKKHDVGVPNFPKRALVIPKEKVVFHNNIPEGLLKTHLGGVDKNTGIHFEGKPLYQGYSGNVLLEQSFDLGAVKTAIVGSPQEQHIFIQFPTGRRELIAHRTLLGGSHD